MFVGRHSETNGDEPPKQWTEAAIRRRFMRGGVQPIKILRRELVARGIFHPSLNERLLAEAQDAYIRRALRAKDESGLPFAGPTGEITADGPLWALRILWEFETYRLWIHRGARQRDAVHRALRTMALEARDRFGKVVEIFGLNGWRA